MKHALYAHELYHGLIGSGNTTRSNDVDTVVDQLSGSLMEMFGVAITVVGLHGMKVHGEGGRVVGCTKSWQWYGYVGLWALGQVVQLLAVKLATEPVIASVSNFAIVCNAVLAYKVLGEPITRLDVGAIGTMIVGAVLVVTFVPEPMKTSLNAKQLRDFFVSSAWPAVGLVGTTIIAAAALPSAVLSVLQPASRAGPSGGVAFGVLAGFAGACSISTSKVCWLVIDADTLGFGGAFALPLWWLYAVLSFVSEVLMVVAVFNGMAWHEASVVVSTYYISMTVFGTVQGLCMFDLMPHFHAGQAFSFVFGVLLCTAAVGVLAVARHSSATSVDQNTLIANGGWDQCANGRRSSPWQRSSAVTDTATNEWRLEPLTAPVMVAPAPLLDAADGASPPQTTSV